MRYTEHELDKAALDDLLNDAKAAQLQAITGPFYPDLGVTKDSLLDYAEKCQRMIFQFAGGGAHKAVLGYRGKPNVDSK